MPPLQPMPLLGSRPHGARGFTLTELMVAVTGGLIVAMSVFAVARDTTRFHQRESRMGEATTGVLIGFQRLQADLARAGYLSSPNIQRDPRLCLAPGATAAGLPSPIRELAPLQMDAPEFAVPTVLGAAPNAFASQMLTLMGSYGADDVFPIWGARVDGGKQIVTLQSKIGPLSRSGFLTSGPLDKGKILGTLFPAGRILRVIDRSGKHFYGVIASVGRDPNTDAPQVELESAPALQIRAAGSNATLCGLEGTDLGTASVINVIRYELRTPAAIVGAKADLAALYEGLSDTSTELAKFDASRVDLVRFELTPPAGGGAAVRDATSLEVIAEYAVELAFGVTGADPATPNAQDLLPTELVTVPVGDATLANWVDAPDAAGTISPQRVRSVRARLRVRSRMPDRGADVDGALGTGYRAYLGTTGTEQHWARVRSLQADVALRNTEGVLW